MGMGCTEEGCEKTKEELVEKMGLSAPHAYGVLDVKEVQVNGQVMAACVSVVTATHGCECGRGTASERRSIHERGTEPQKVVKGETDMKTDSVANQRSVRI